MYSREFAAFKAGHAKGTQEVVEMLESMLDRGMTVETLRVVLRQLRILNAARKSPDCKPGHTGEAA